MRGNLLWKLLAINLPIIALIVLVVWVAIDFLAADYFTALMEQYKIDPAETHQMFLDAVHRYFIQATVLALLLDLQVDPYATAIGMWSWNELLPASVLGVADVKAFGLTWEDCEWFLSQLGYTVRIEVVAE